MKQVIPRFIAVLLLAIPGLAATYGFLLMKDAAFNYFYSFGEDQTPHHFQWWLFLGGFLLFGAGVAFIGGWTFFRDRKRNYVSSRFREKRPRPSRPSTK